MKGKEKMYPWRSTKSFDDAYDRIDNESPEISYAPSRTFYSIEEKVNSVLILCSIILILIFFLFGKPFGWWSFLLPGILILTAITISTIKSIKEKRAREEFARKNRI